MMPNINVLQGIAPKIAESAHIYRQILAAVAASMLLVSGGISFGFTAVLLPQLESDPSFPYDKSFDTWIASISPLAETVACLVSGFMSDSIGRRMGQLILLVPFSLGWVILGLAKNNTVMLIGRFVTGICTGAVRAYVLVYVGELTDPKYRSTALFISTMAKHCGCLFSHIVGKYVYWKTSCFIFIFPNIIRFIILMFLKESPLWLLSKGKINEGIESFREFRGSGESSEKELAAVLQKSKENSEETSTFKDTLNIIFSKPFMKSFGTIFLLFIVVQWCGINTISFYAQTIFEKTFSGDIDAFMLMLVTDCIRVFTGTLVCMFAKVMPRKLTFVSCCLTITILLVGLVTYLYLKPVGMVWVAVTCMVLYIAVASALPSISWSFVAEIFPAKVRGFASGICSATSMALLFISVKVTPEIMYRFGAEVMYLGFAGVTLIAGIFLSFIIPDTNGKSLQDIENELYKKKVAVKKDVDMVTVPSNSTV